MMSLDLQKMVNRCGSVCKNKGWKKNWIHGGCYLHLEVSEFIESLRGKGTSTPTDEAGDILMALFTTLEYYKIPISDVLESLELTLDHLEAKS